MADDKERVWKAFGQMIQRRMFQRQTLIVPKMGTFTFTPELPGPSVAIFIAAEDIDQPNVPVRPTNNQLPTLDFPELASVAFLPVERARQAFDMHLAEIRYMVQTESEARKRLPGVGEFVMKDGILVLVYDRPGSRGWEGQSLMLDLKKPPKTPSAKSSREKTMQMSSVSPRVEFLFHNQAKLLIAFQKLDKDETGLLPFNKVVEAVIQLDNPIIQADVVRNLIDMTSSEVEGLVDYRRFMSNLGRFRTQRCETASSVLSPRTDFTTNYDLSAVMPLIRKIWEKKLILVEFGHKGGMRPRIKTTSSELLTLMKKAGVRVNLHQLHAVLREGQLDQFSVSLLDLIEYARRTLQDNSSDLSSISETFTEGSISRLGTPAHPDEYLEKIRRFFSKFSIEEVIRIAKGDDDYISSERFMMALTEVGGGRIRAVEAQKAFHRATAGRNNIDEAEFRAIFQPQATKTDTLTKSFRILREWLRKDKLTSEQAFERLLTSADASSVLTREQFSEALSPFPLNTYELDLLFHDIDTKQDNVIDLGEWCNKVYEEYGLYQSLRDVILGNNLNTEDLLIKMNIGNKQRLSAEELATVLQTMDASLSAMKAVEMATAATHRHGYVDVQDFLQRLSQEVPPYEGDWKTHIYKRIQVKIKGDPKNIRALFEEMDIHHTGRLGLADFQDCVFKADVGLEPVEIERLARVLDRNNSHQIDYNDFVDRLKGPNLPAQDPVRVVTERLLVFLNQNAMTPATLLKRLGGKASKSAFIDFLSAKVQKSMSRAELSPVVDRMDMNQDGYIDLEDLSAVLANRSRVSVKHARTYPIEPLQKGKAKEILKAVRAAFVQKRVNFADAFRVLDKNGIGMLTAQDWSDGLTRFIDLSNPIKDGFFATMDSKRIGLVDYATFLKVLRDGEFESSESRDSWAFEESVLDKIRTWIKEQGISVESAFRAFDRDFDGVVSKTDLKESLATLLKISEADLPSSKLDRVYKLLDSYKRDSVQLPDFKLLFEESISPQWKQSAKQQLGVYLSKAFPNLETGFEAISQFSGKLTFEQFQAWVTEKNALAGFNLTHDLLQQFYADMDAHRKGYLTLQDWNLAFIAHSWKEQHFKELTDAIRVNFSDVQSALTYFGSFRIPPAPAITLEIFQKGVHNLIPKRFTPKEIAECWAKVNPENKPEAGLAEFTAAFGDLAYRTTTDFSNSAVKTNQSWPSLPRTKTAPISVNVSTSRFGSILHEENPWKEFYSLLSATPVRLEEAFEAFDPAGTGILTPFEFRQALRKLNLGLTSRDIDRLLTTTETLTNGCVNWREVLARGKGSEAEMRIKQVAENRLARLRTNMFEYLLSPGDAFKQADEARAGKITFQQFSDMVKHLCTLSRDEAPSFPVLKDLFDLIDSRHDGFLDFKEWSSAFKLSSSLNWEDTTNFEQISASISRNRKMLQLAFEAVGKGDFVSYGQARQVLGMALKGFRLSDHQWRTLLKVADRNHAVDFRLLLEIYKSRSLAKTLHPKPIGESE